MDDMTDISLFLWAFHLRIVYLLMVHLEEDLTLALFTFRYGYEAIQCVGLDSLFDKFDLLTMPNC